MDRELLDTLESQAAAMVRDLQRLAFLGQVPGERLHPLCLWAANLGLDAPALCRLVWTAGTRQLAGAGDDVEDLIAAVAGGPITRTRVSDDLPF